MPPNSPEEAPGREISDRTNFGAHSLYLIKSDAPPQAGGRNALIFLPEELRSSIEIEIRQALESLRQSFERHSAGRIVEELIAAVFAGGKRMRPLLCCWGHEAAGGELSPAIVKVAASLELLHTFAIIHDDIMDAPDTRRRQPPAQARAGGPERGLEQPGDAGRYGVSVAMLAGDLALVASDQMYAESGFEPEKLAAGWDPLSRMRLDAVAGQYLDLSLSGTDLSPDTASGIARLKSGSYSVRGPLAVGAVLAGAGASARMALDSFGEALGEAFQLADDLLGMFGDPSLTGKDAESDLSQGRPTLLIALALERSPATSVDAIRAAWGNPEASSGQRQAARQAIIASGAPAQTVARIRKLVDQAKLSIDDPHAKNLKEQPCSYLYGLADDILFQVDRLK